MIDETVYNKYNNYSYITLTQLESTIKKMDSSHHVKILRLIEKSAGRDTINSSGNECYINLTYLNEDTLNEIKNYVDHATIQDTFINETERKKQEFRETLFSKNDNVGI